MKLDWRFVVLLFAVGLIACGGPDEPKKKPTEKKKSASGPQFKKEGELYFVKATGDTIRKIDIEIAEPEYERTRGLMYRRNMKDTQGMLFIFDKPDMRSFWMKNTYIPLDIMFVDSILIRFVFLIETSANSLLPLFPL